MLPLHQTYTRMPGQRTLGWSVFVAKLGHEDSWNSTFLMQMRTIVAWNLPLTRYLTHLNQELLFCSWSLYFQMLLLLYMMCLWCEMRPSLSVMFMSERINVHWFNTSCDHLCTWRNEPRCVNQGRKLNLSLMNQVIQY